MKKKIQKKYANTVNIALACIQDGANRRRCTVHLHANKALPRRPVAGQRPRQRDATFVIFEPGAKVAVPLVASPLHQIEPHIAVHAHEPTEFHRLLRAHERAFHAQRATLRIMLDGRFYVLG